MANAPSKPSCRRTVIALCLGLSFPLITVLCGLQFFWIAPGSEIRPIGWVGLIALLSGLGFMFVVPFAMHCWYYERRVLLALLAAALSVTPILLGSWLVRFASRIVGFTISQ